MIQLPIIGIVWVAALVMSKEEINEKQRIRRTNIRIAEAEEIRLRRYNHTVLDKIAKRIKRENGLSFTPQLYPPSPYYKSFQIKNVVQDYPELKPPLIRVLRQLFLSDIQSINGPYVSIDSKKGNAHRPNILFPSGLVHYYGAPILEMPSEVPGYEYRRAYARGTARGTKGIPLTQLKNRLFDTDMQFLADALQIIIKDRHPYLMKDNTVDMNTRMNTLSPVIYACKDRNPRKVEQMPLHNDVIYDKVGSDWVYNENNSQMENTATITLSVGSMRELVFQEWKVGATNQPRTLLRDVFKQENGDVFFLHPLDEKPECKHSTLRRYFTNFKHGGVMFGDKIGEMSIALCFRTAASNSTLLCHKETGFAHTTQQQKEKCVVSDAKLENIETEWPDFSFQATQMHLQCLYRLLEMRYGYN